MTESPPPSIEEAAAETTGAKKISTLMLAIAGGVALAVAGGFVALVVWLARSPEAGSQKANTNILAAVKRASKLYDRAQKLMANVVFTDAAGRTVAPFTSDLVTSPEQIKLLAPTTPNPKALDSINEAVDGLQQALVDNRSAGEDVQALAHKLLSRVLALKGHYHTAKSLTDRAGAGSLLGLAEQSIDVMRAQMTFIEHYDRLAAMTNDDVKAIHAEALSTAKDLKTKQVEVSNQITDLGNKVDRMKASSVALAAKARAARSESQRAKGQKGLDLLEQALAYEKQTYDLANRIGKAQDQVRALWVEFQDLGLREVSARERAEAAKAILDSREEETAKRLAERDQCRKLLGESENSAIDLMDRIVQLCVQAKTAEAGAVNAYLEADKELGAAKAGEPARYAQYEADKADIAMAVANLTMERLSLQERLRLLATSITNLWPKLSPPRQAPPAAGKLTAYVADPEKLRSDATACYRNATRLYSKAIKSAAGIHKWVYQGRLAAAYVGLYRLSKDTDELNNADRVINQALQDKDSSPYLEPVLKLRRLVRAERGGPTSAPSSAPSSVPADTAPSTGL